MHAVAAVGLALPALGRGDGADHGQPVHPGEVPVALVLGGHGHDGAGAVAHEHVVGQVEGHGLIGERVAQVGAGEHAALVERPFGLEPVDLAGVASPGHEGVDLGSVVGGDQVGDLGMLGGHDRVGHAEAGVRSGGEDAHRLDTGPDDRFDIAHGQVELGALGSADPVALHDLDLLGPGQAVQVVEQLLGVVGDLEEPLLEVSLLDHGPRALGRAVGQHLLVGQHRPVDGIPVDRGVGPIGQAGLVEPDEDPLGPAHVGGVVAGHLAPPVVATADAHQRAAQLGDAGVGEGTGMDAGLDGRVLGGQAERVEAHGREHGVAVHGAVPR